MKSADNFFDKHRRRGYDDWWQALDWLRDGLEAGDMLREVEVTVAMPKVQPWGS